MAQPMQDLAELEVLLNALCEESIAPEQVRRLEELVLTRPEAQAYYLQYMRFYADLAGHFALLAIRRRCGASCGKALRSLLREARQREELQQAQQATLRRVESKEQVVRDVIAQRCSLREALARFQELDRELDRLWPDSFPKQSEMRARQWSSEVEGHYQYMIVMVKALLRGRPEEAAAILSRLEKDYQQLQTNTQTPSTAPMERTERHR